MYFFSNFASCSLVNGVLGFLSALCFLRVHFSGSCGKDVGISGCILWSKNGGMWGNMAAGGNSWDLGGETGLGDSLGDGDDLTGDEVLDDGDGDDLLDPGEVDPDLTVDFKHNSLSLLSPAVHFSDSIKSIPKDKTLLSSMVVIQVNFLVVQDWLSDLVSVTWYLYQADRPHLTTASHWSTPWRAGHWLAGQVRPGLCLRLPAVTGLLTNSLMFQIISLTVNYTKQNWIHYKFWINWQKLTNNKQTTTHIDRHFFLETRLINSNCLSSPPD